MTLSARLWSDNADLAAEVLAHPFVRGIGDGSLPREQFARYLAQDAFFLESFARAYALALARSDNTATLLTLADLLTGVRQELGLHASYAGSWGIDMAGVEPLPATSAYTEFLLATACTEDLGVIFAAMTPCMRLYAWLGSFAGRRHGRAVRRVGADLRRSGIRRDRPLVGTAAGRARGHAESTHCVPAGDAARAGLLRGCVQPRRLNRGT